MALADILKTIEERLGVDSDDALKILQKRLLMFTTVK